MPLIIRIVAVLVLLLPLFLNSGCVDVLDPGMKPGLEDADVGVEADVDEETDADEVHHGWGLEPVEVVDRRPRDEGPDEGEGAPEEEEDDPRVWVRDEAPPAGELYVDEEAADLTIRSVQVREGSEAYYVSVTCHDDGLARPSWRRFSERCDANLATAVRAIRFEPDLNFRIAPSPLGFRIMGAFEQGTYELEIAAGLRTSAGAYLKEDFRQTLEIPELSPSLSIAADGRYLPRSAWDELTLHHRNLEEARLTIRHVPSSNMAFWLSGHNDAVDQRLGNQVVNEELLLPSRTDRELTTILDLQDLVGDPAPGIYQIEVVNGRTRATSRLQVTEMSLIAKRHEAAPGQPWEEGIDVWAVGMESTEPIAGVTVQAIRPSGSRMARCRTNLVGHCRLELPAAGVDPAPPMAILATRGDDMAYLKFDDVRIEGGVQHVDGPAFLDDRSYRATLHGDRDLYRPGDDFHLLGALRDLDYRSAGEGIPVDLTITNPQGQVVVERSIDTDAHGTVSLTFRINAVAPTGRWRASLLVGETELETYRFHVEEFMPERLEVSVEPSAEEFVRGEEMGFEVEARYLFGASAQGSEVEINCRLVPIEAQVAAAGDYHYGPIAIDERRSIVDLGRATGVIGEDDLAEVKCPEPTEQIVGTMRVEANVAVSEGGSGRATHGSAEAIVHPSQWQIGLKADVDDLAAGDGFGLSGRIVDVDGSLVEDVEETVTLEFYNIRRHFSWQRDHRGRSRYQKNYELILERVQDVEVEGGTFTAQSVAADVHHAYLVRAQVGDARSDLRLQRRGMRWSWSSQSSGTPMPRRPTEVTIETPEVAPIDELTRVSFTSPFAGRALVTVESDRVVEMAWIDAQEGVNEWAFQADGEDPNVYVGVFVIRNPREVGGGAFAPERAFGAVSLPVDNARLETSVRIRTDEEVRPGDTMRIEVDTGLRGQSAVATVAAVDEGILQLTGYRTPDPLAVLWQERRLGVETFDTVGWATRLPPADASSRTGGGAGDFYGDDDDSGRIMPFRPVALWSGPVEVGEDGRATVEFEVPNYRGRLRVMTAVFGDEQLGTAEADVLVRDPLTLQTTFPRQLTDEDEALVPVFLTNLTETEQEIDVEISAQPYDLPGYALASDGSGLPVLEYVSDRKQTTTLAPGASTVLYFEVRAGRAGGAAALMVEARSDEHYSVDEALIPFRPRGPVERRTEIVTLRDGWTDLSGHVDGWLPTTEETTIFASALPEPGAFDHLERLIRYPHGCAEQTLSTVRPMVFIPDLVEGLDPVHVNGSQGITSMVEAGIDRLLSMQTPSGGFAYWPGGRQPSHSWVTAHVLHFFMDAQSRGYSVPQGRIDSAARWLSRQVSNGVGDAYQHYVLARAGEASPQMIRQAIERLPDEPQGRAREQAYLLKAALYMTGDRSFATDLMNPRVDIDEQDGRDSGWGFYSHRRQRAMMLGIFIELFGRHEGATHLADAVTRDLVRGGRRGLTTQEMAWALNGLGQWYDLENAEDVNIELHVNGELVEAQALTASHRAWTVRGASEVDELSVHLDRGDYDGQLTVLLRSRGVRVEPTEESGGQGLRVDRSYLDARGRVIDGQSVAPGDVIYSRVRLRNTSGERLQQLALVDRIPAGLEIENPDLGAAELPSWASNSWSSDHVNTRDDRVEVYGSLNRNQEVLLYVPLRATISGEYYAPPVEVEAMYDPEVWARDEAGEMSVGAPFTALVD